MFSLVCDHLNSTNCCFLYTKMGPLYLNTLYKIFTSRAGPHYRGRYVFYSCFQWAGCRQHEQSACLPHRAEWCHAQGASVRAAPPPPWLRSRPPAAANQRTQRPPASARTPRPPPLSSARGCSLCSSACGEKNAKLVLLWLNVTSQQCIEK